MVLNIKSPILGFESLQSVVLKKLDDIFSTLHSTNDSKAEVSFTVANPYSLRSEYDFEIPESVKMKLEIDENTPIEVYNMVVTQEPIENSIVNFLAPIIVNADKKLLAQVTLDPQKYPHLAMDETIANLKQ